MPESAVATALQTDAVPAAAAEPDLTALLMEADAPGETAAQAKVDETAQAAAPADSAATTTDAKDGKAADAAAGTEQAAKDGTEATATLDAAKPGTPDKALQKMQQDLAAAQRKLDDLNAKIDAGEALSPREKEQQQAATRSLDKIRDGLAKKGEAFDVLDHSKAIADTLLETDDALAEVRKELKQTRAEVAELRKGNQASQSDQAWKAVQQEYAGVNVNAVWDKSLADTMEAMGIDAETAKATPALGQALINAASKTFHQRADAARKSAAGKSGGAAAAAAATTTTTPRTTPPVTPGGARVSESSGVVNAGDTSEDAQYVKAAMSLIADD